MAFAIADGNFSDGAIWDTGVAPSGSENAYANAKTIQVTGTVSVGVVRNDASNYYLPNTVIPLMTSATSPSGVVSWSTQVAGSEAYRAFDRNTATLWQTTAGVQSGTITYKFDTGKTIKKYYWKAAASATTSPRNFTFLASNDPAFVIGVVTLDSPGPQSVGVSGSYSASFVNTIPYLYYRLSVTSTNGATLQIAEIEMTESTSNAVGQLPGGTFNLTNISTLNCSAPTGVVVGSATPPITFALPFGSSASVNATIPSITAITAYYAVLLNGLGTLYFVGDISCGSISASNLRVINITAAGKLEYNGNCTTGGNSGNQTNSIFSAVAGYIKITTTGFSGGNGGAITNSSVYLNAGGTLEIIGPVTAGGAPAVGMVGGTVTITGNVSTTTAFPAISNITTAGSIEPGGAITTTGLGNAISSIGYVKVIVPLVNVNNWQPVSASKLTIEPTTTSITFQKVSGGNQAMQIGTIVNTYQPNVGDVRLGTTYGGVPNEFTGTMAVPLPSSVSQGVPVDTSVGTFLMTPASFVQELGVSTIPVAVRLQNSATVITTGTQLASFNI